MLDSTRWLAYFQGREGLALDAPFHAPFSESPGRAAIAASLARFELGESGDGARLRALAASTGDADYARAVELFVAEEQRHAVWLTRLRRRFGGTALTSHWSERTFVLLRHVGGLRFELCVLLTAEVIALTYYRVLALADPDPALQATCRRILADERGHVAFHRATLSAELGTLHPMARWPARALWRAFTAATATVVAHDHRDVLALAGVSRHAFVEETRQRIGTIARPLPPHALPTR